MTKFNKTENFVLKPKVNTWKEKAKYRRLMIDKLNRRIKELLCSRENWKAKYKEQKAINDQLNKALKCELRIEDCPEKHSFSVQLILLVTWLRTSSQMSLRSIQKMVVLLNVIYDLEMKIPSTGSIQNWEQKLGYHRLVNGDMSGGAERSESWAVILDESVSFGSEKLLLILGIPLDNYTFDKSPAAADVHILGIGIAKAWNGESITKELKHLKSKGYEIKYGISDGDSRMKKGIRDSQLKRIADCTHAFGNILKRHYKKSDEFTTFTKDCNVLRKQVMVSSMVLLSPPTMRTKAKFLNLWERSKWGYQLLELMEKYDCSSKLSTTTNGLSEEMYQRISWLKKYDPMIKLLYLRCETINHLHKVLKNNGLSKKTVIDCHKILNQKYLVEGGSIDDFFIKGIRKYLEEQLEILASLDGVKQVICTSDIIESFFGKYKQRSKKGAKLLTADCLSIANFSENFSKKEIRQAMENVKIVDLRKWKNDNCPTNLRTKRKKLFKNVG